MTAYLSALVALIQREPIRTVAVVRSFIALLLAFWPGLVTSDQSLAIIGLTAVLLGVDETIRRNVTPTAKLP